MFPVRTNAQNDVIIDIDSLSPFLTKTIEVKYQGNYLPKRNSPGAAGYDLVYEGDDVIVFPGKIQKLNFTVGFALPPNTHMQIHMRSSFGSLGLSLLCHIVDSDYRGFVKAVLINLSDQPIEIKRFMRVCQGVIIPCMKYDLNQVDDFTSNTERGEGGFGSTGLSEV